ncbi:MAG TPA: SpoIIE family protein phosphatase [Blastocatellia bacterium]|nr:SpoIIE family protein phosphatase [Blastocatellia bacterium]
MKSFESIGLTHEGDIGQAKRAVRRRAAEIGFNDRQLAEIDIAINEIGSNAVKFGRGTGQLYFTPADPHLDPAGIEIIYTDKGPGIEDTSLAIEDGYTTAGSMGAGLGAIRRMADEFYIYSVIESQTRRLPLFGRTTHGTAIVFRKRLENGAPERIGPSLWGIFTRAPAGESHNGDAYVVRRNHNRYLLAVIDGLGHGLGAMEASQAAVISIGENETEGVENIVRRAHDALRATRGVVLGLAAIDLSTGEVEYAGIGNADFRVLSGHGSQRFISINGTLGSRLDRVKVFREKLPKVATIVMSTDGISERWDPDNYPGLLGLHPQLLCAVVMRDYSRPKDDATIVCGRLSFDLRDA